ncbi:MAG: FGGY-family carbohydrate kinase [Fimbriimonadaceae bacterium]
MGASSARFAAGRIEGGRLGFEVIEQIAHGPSDSGFRASGIPSSQYPIPRLTWNFDLLLGLCNRAVEYASASFDEATIGIDTWGVDHGFLDSKGNLAQPMAAYRDESHAMAMATIEEHQARLYRLTGIQKQPFNTLCQLIARRLENPKLPEQATWLLLPDLFGFYLHSQRPTLNPQHFGSELSIASTTQMVGLDGQWCDEAFEIAGWPVPDLQPEKPGRMIGHAANSVEIIRVGGHDSAAAVCGLGRIDDDTAFMNVGTWSILGCLLVSPMTSEEAREANFTNERGADGRIRFLANIPGFYVMNRLKEELQVEEPMADWLARADRSVTDRLDLFAPGLFSPGSMIGAITEQIGWQPARSQEWAGVALMSLAETTATQLRTLCSVTGRRFSLIRAGGGGSASMAFCEAVADACGIPVLAGPAEATVLGNLGMQALAKGVISDFDELEELMRRSAEARIYHPRE